MTVQDERVAWHKRELIRHNDETCTVEIFPPWVRYVEIGLEHVRAADSIRVSYDFERDGYKIEQSRITDDNPQMNLWQEVAFIPAWGLDERVDVD